MTANLSVFALATNRRKKIAAAIPAAKKKASKTEDQSTSRPAAVPVPPMRVRTLRVTDLRVQEVPGKAGQWTYNLYLERFAHTELVDSDSVMVELFPDSCYDVAPGCPRFSLAHDTSRVLHEALFGGCCAPPLVAHARLSP